MIIVEPFADRECPRFLFAEAGARVDPTASYKWYINMNKTYLDVDWGVRASRHAMIAIAKEHIMPNETFTAVQRALADSSDHSVAVENAHYAIKFNDVRRLSNLEIWQARWLVQQ